MQQEQGPKLTRRQFLEVATISTGAVALAIGLYFARKKFGHTEPIPVTPTPPKTPETIQVTNIEKLRTSPVHAIEFQPEGKEKMGMFVAVNGGFFTSSDGGSTWQELNLDRKDLFYPQCIAATNQGELYCGTNFGEILHLTPQALERVALVRDTGLGIKTLAIDPKDSKHLLAGTDVAGIFQSHDSGKTWGKFPTWPTQDNASTIQSIIFDAQHPSDIYVGTMNTGLWKSTDSGSKWERLVVFDIEGQPIDIQSLKVATHGIYAGTTHGLFRSTDHGSSWQQLTDIDTKIIATGNDATPIAIASRKTVYISKDFSTWTEVFSTGIESDISSLAVAPSNTNHLWIGTEAGLYIAKNGQQTTKV